MRRVVCLIEDSGGVSARIVGGHLTKRELLRVLKAIKLEYRHSVRTYRQKMIVERSEEVVEATAEVAKAAAKQGVRDNGKD